MVERHQVGKLVLAVPSASEYAASGSSQPYISIVLRHYADNLIVGQLSVLRIVYLEVSFCNILLLEILLIACK